MPIDLFKMMRGRVIARGQGIEEMAQRIAAGDAVAPEDIEAALVANRSTLEELQARVDALERRAELKREIADGEKARKRIGVIEAEISKAAAVVEDAQTKYRAVREKYANEQMVLSNIDLAGRLAVDKLLDPALLTPGQKEQLDAMKAAVMEATERRKTQADLVDECRQRVESTESKIGAFEKANKRIMPGASEWIGDSRTDLEKFKQRHAAEADKIAPLDAAVAAAERAVREFEATLRA